MAEQEITRGRPRTADPERISRTGVRLIVERGWSATTMGDIAEACDVSTPTMFRYFPTKVSLLWYGVEHNAALFRHYFDRRSPGSLATDAIIDAYLEMLHSSGQLPLIKTRMAVLAVDAEASQAASAIDEQWRDLVIAFSAECRGEAADSLLSRIHGATIWAGLWAAVTTWARSDDALPDDFVDTARRLLARMETEA